MARQRSVLVVDDDDTLRATLMKIFVKAGYQAQAASNAQEASTILAEAGVDLVLADLKMPGKNGLSLLEEIRTLRPESKVIIMTAYGTRDTRADAMARGAFAYLNKPVSRGELLGLCEKAFDGS